MKCLLCQKRKGKRFCPAKNREICAQCCGEKRVVEISCPSDCVYLQSGQVYQAVKKHVAQLRQEEDPVRRRKLYQTNYAFRALLGEIEAAIIHYAGNLRTLTDQQILEAVTLLKETYRTEQRGVIYEHASPNPLVQGLRSGLRDCLEHIREEAITAGEPLKISDLVDCLEVLESDIRYHLQKVSGRESYLSFIRRNHPEIASQASSEGNLIEF